MENQSKLFFPITYIIGFIGVQTWVNQVSRKKLNVMFSKLFYYNRLGMTGKVCFTIK